MHIRLENRLAADTPVPADLVLASASGLDPHITPAAALLQSRRVANQRKIPQPQIETLISQHIEQPLWGIWGKERVNVLKLNLAVDEMKNERH